MPIDMSNYKMIYKDEVFNVVNIMPTVDFGTKEPPVIKVKFIQATYINENGELQMISDEAFMFKFMRR